jgi:hypothetical protein
LLVLSSNLLIFKDDNLALPNIGYLDRYHMAEDEKKEVEKKWKKLEQEEMKEEDHQLELKEGYEQDEAYDGSED